MGVFSVAVFDFLYPDEQRLEHLRQEFVAKFPVSKLPGLKLEEYALGVDAKDRSAAVNVLDQLSMAGFGVTLHGRIWVTPEVQAIPISWLL